MTDRKRVDASVDRAARYFNLGAGLFALACFVNSGHVFRMSLASSVIVWIITVLYLVLLGDLLRRFRGIGRGVVETSKALLLGVPPRFAQVMTFLTTAFLFTHFIPRADAGGQGVAGHAYWYVALLLLLGVASALLWWSAVKSAARIRVTLADACVVGFLLFLAGSPVLLKSADESQPELLLRYGAVLLAWLSSRGMWQPSDVGDRSVVGKAVISLSLIGFLVAASGASLARTGLSYGYLRYARGLYAEGKIVDAHAAFRRLIDSSMAQSLRWELLPTPGMAVNETDDYQDRLFWRSVTLGDNHRRTPFLLAAALQARGAKLQALELLGGLKQSAETGIGAFQVAALMLGAGNEAGAREEFTRALRFGYRPVRAASLLLGLGADLADLEPVLSAVISDLPGAVDRGSWRLLGVSVHQSVAGLGDSVYVTGKWRCKGCQSLSGGGQDDRVLLVAGDVVYHEERRANLVRDGAFEYSPLGPPPDRWRRGHFGAHARTKAIVQDTTRANGTHCLLLDGTDAPRVSAKSAPIDLSPGTLYVQGGWRSAMGPGNGTGLIGRIYSSGRPGDAGALHRFAPKTAHEVRSGVVQDLITAAEHAGREVRIWLVNPTQGPVLFDEIYLGEVGTPAMAGPP